MRSQCSFIAVAIAFYGAFCLLNVVHAESIDATNPTVGYLGTKTFNQTGCTEYNTFGATGNLVGVCVIDSSTESHVVACNSTMCINYNFGNTACSGAPTSDTITPFSGECNPSTNGYSQEVFMEGDDIYDHLGTGKVYVTFEESSTCSGNPTSFTFAHINYCDESTTNPTMVTGCDGSETLYNSYPSGNSCANNATAGTTPATGCVVDNPIFTSTYCITAGPPTGQPTGQPTLLPSSTPTGFPTSPTGQPTGIPTGQPSSLPTRMPTAPSGQPSGQPTSQPSTPTGQPTGTPSGTPSGVPTNAPSDYPTEQPTSAPTSVPTTSPASTSSLSSGAIAGIVLGTIFGAVLIAFLVLIYCLPEQARALGLGDTVDNEDLKKSMLTGEASGKHGGAVAATGGSSSSSNPMRPSDGIVIQPGDDSLL